MDEEVLYWTDHQSRETSLESPRRRFTELRAQDVNWPDRWMGRFGLLTEAEYEVALEPGKGEFLISFRFAQEIPEEGYSDYLLNGFCMDEVYQMEVKNSLGEPVQEQELKLCMEKTDTILFEDLDGDGCTDMKILYPRHEFEGLEDYGYWLWNRREQRFERIRESELFAPGRETEAEKGPETIAVQPGDSLWKLAEEHYGDGFRYMEIYEKNRAVIGPDPSMIRAGAVLELP